MLSEDFQIPLMAGRLSEAQKDVLNVAALLVLYIGATANAQRNTFYVNLREFSAWAACDHKQARRAMDAIEQAGFVVDVIRRSHGLSGGLGVSFKKTDVDATLAVKVYMKAFGGLRPHHDERKLIRDQVGTDAGRLKLFAGVCQDWRNHKHNPADIDGLLQRFDLAVAKAKTVPVAATVGDEEVPGWAK